MSDAVSTQTEEHSRDRAALSDELLTFAPVMFRLAARLLGNTADAEEVLQESYAKALPELSKGAFQKSSSLKTWLYRVVTNVALDRLRERKQRPSEPFDVKVHEALATTNPEAVTALRELFETMQELPEDQRAALVLKEVQGLSTGQVAQVLERTEGAVEQLLVRARQTLKRRFES